MTNAKRETKSIARLFIDHAMSHGASLTLDKDQSHYIATVMRKKLGDNLLVFNGKDGEFFAKITDLQKRSVTITLTEQTKDQTSDPDIWLVFAPIKRARLDFIAQKATELGVSRLTPIMTRRTIVDRVKTDRMTANAIEAAEQCERLTIPAIDEAIPLTKLLDSWPNDRAIMFCDEDLSGDNAIEKLSSLSGKHEKWAIFIGPEGGFDDTEREKIKAYDNTVTVHLGPRLLRADTAAMAAISLWQACLGDWS